MPQKYANNARTKLASGISASDTSISVLAGSGDLFPVASADADALPSSNDWFKLFLTDVSGEIEIVGVRTRASGSDVLSNVVRAMDGTTARIWGVGAVAYLAFSALDLDAVLSRAEAAVVAAQQAAQMNVGLIGYFPGINAPAGWLKANGQAVSRSTYANLFSYAQASGNLVDQASKQDGNFGTGDGSTTFTLPEYRGEFVRGWDDGRGIDAGRAIGSSQSSQNLAHSHTGTIGGGDHAHSMAARTSANGFGNGIAAKADSSTNNSSRLGTDTAGHTHTLTINDSGGTEARPRNVPALACIKY